APRPVVAECAGGDTPYCCATCSLSERSVLKAEAVVADGQVGRLVVYTGLVPLLLTLSCRRPLQRFSRSHKEICHLGRRTGGKLPEAREGRVKALDGPVHREEQRGDAIVVHPEHVVAELRVGALDELGGRQALSGFPVEVVLVSCFG